MRMPRTEEIVSGCGLSMGIWLFILSPLKIPLTRPWISAVAIFGSLAICIFIVMKLRDGQRKYRAAHEATVTGPDDDGFITVACPGLGCEGSISLKPPKEEDIFVRCPRCSLTLGVGQNARGRVVGYSTWRVQP
jgi:hypothetical protein